MADVVALLRGVNVGGVTVRMADLRRLAGALPSAMRCRDVATHLASGNLVLTADVPPADLARALETALQAHYGRPVPVLVLPGAELAAALADCPFDPPEGRQVHGFFLFGPPAFDAARYARLRLASEVVEMRPGVAWLFAPEGVGRSKLAADMGRVLGCVATARNLNTIRALAEMLDARAGG